MFFLRTDIEKYGCKIVLGTNTNKQNKQSSETSGGRRRGAGYRNSAQIVSGGDITDRCGRGGAWGARPRIRAAAGKRRQGVPLTQGGGSGRSGPRRRSRREREGRVLPTPPIPGAGKKQGWEGKEEVLSGTWVPKRQVPAASPRETAGLGQESKARRGGRQAFSLSAPAPPHSLCHTTLFSPLSVTGGAIFPNTAEEQPPPPFRSLF